MGGVGATIAKHRNVVLLFTRVPRTLLSMTIAGGVPRNERKPSKSEEKDRDTFILGPPSGKAVLSIDPPSIKGHQTIVDQASPEERSTIVSFDTVRIRDEGRPDEAEPSWASKR